ncbi:MAG TPA: MOFRL family protein, partial [Acidimicrobiia bacterium]
SGHDVGYVASGPTLACPRQPDRAIELMEAHGLSVDAAARASMKAPPPPTSNGPVTVIADGMTAARAVAAAAAAEAVGGKVHSDWLTGPVEMCLASLMATSGPGLTVGAGEPSVRVTGGGAGGRNTHAALLAALRIAGTDTVFAALATDGVDGSSGAAGAIVDGATVARGRRVEQALAGFDSAGYLAKTGDLVVTGPTGTNVADLWAIWHS